MHTLSKLSRTRLDVKRKLEGPLPKTPLDYCTMLAYLTTSYTNEELGQFLDISESTVVRMLRYDKLPTKEQCLKIRRLLDERN